MGFVLDHLNDIRSQIATDDDVLSEAKKRRNTVKKAGMDFEGSLRSFNSGSVAHGTVNSPVTDADAGLVLDRRKHSTLGPDADGDGDGPQELVDDLCEFIGPKVREDYPNAKMQRSRRGVLVTFSEPLNDDEDPTVDLIPTLTRKDADGLWIPDLDDDTWSASHPEEHTNLLTSGDKTLRALRARATRTCKAWNKQWETKSRALSSFNVEVLVWEYVTDASVGLDEVVTGWFRYAHDELKKALTKDPAGVSEDISLLLDKEKVLDRLKGAADKMDEALEADENDDEEKVRELVSGVFHKYIDPPKGSKAELASAFRSSTVGATKTGIAIGTGAPLKPTRAFGSKDNA
jgi:hypothetical protein